MSTNDADFNALLDKPASDFKPPVVLPVGSYTWQVAKFEFGKTPPKPDNKGNTPYVEFHLVPVAAGEDVDADALNESLNGAELNSKVRRESFYLTPDAAYRLTEFAVGCGVDTDQSTREVIQQCVGQTVMGYLTHAPNTKNPTGQPYVNVGQWTAVG